MKKKFLILSIALATSFSSHASEQKFEVKFSPSFVNNFAMELELNYQLNNKVTLGVSYGNNVFDYKMMIFNEGRMQNSEKAEFHARYFPLSNKKNGPYWGMAPGAIIVADKGKRDLTHFVLPSMTGYQLVLANRFVLSSEMGFGAAYDLKKSQLNFHYNLIFLSFGTVV